MAGHKALFVVALGPEAAAAMHGWLDAGNTIAGVWRPQTGSGRRDKRMAFLAARWSVAAAAQRGGVGVRTVPRLSTWDEALAQARETEADVLVSVYFPHVVPQHMLDMFGSRAVNFHPAPLPLYRGPTPVLAMQLDRTLISDAAMTLHVMTAGLDEGQIIAQRRVELSANAPPTLMRTAFARAARALVADDLQQHLSGQREPVPQDKTRATYRRVGREELDLSPALTVEETKYRCAVIANSFPLPFEGIEGARIVGFVKQLGPPTGSRPDVHPLSVDVDVRDARVRLRTKWPLYSQYQRVRGLVSLMREQA